MMMLPPILLRTPVTNQEARAMRVQERLPQPGGITKSPYLFSLSLGHLPSLMIYGYVGVSLERVDLPKI